MRVVHVTPAFYPAHVPGGPIYSLYEMCKAVVGNGIQVRVLTTDANGTDRVLDVEKAREVEAAEGLPVRYCRRVMPQSVSPTLLRLLPSYIRWADVVHLTAVYSFPTIPSLLACKVLEKPVVWSPRGAFQRWEGSRRRTLKTVWEWACRMVAPKRLVLHVTSEEEAKESLERFPGVDTAIIPNGIGVPEKVAHVRGNGVLRLLYLGRLHPKKGIENLLAACRIVEDALGIPWSLTVAGAGDPKYAETIKLRVAELDLSRRVKMVGEVVGEGKGRLFENADLAVVPSHTENFGMVVAEALAHGVPVIASRGTPWQRLEEIGCGLWVENTPESLAWAIKEMSRMPLREMGQLGREWMQREFRWEMMARELIKCYEAAVVGGVRHAV